MTSIRFLFLAALLGTACAETAPETLRIGLLVTHADAVALTAVDPAISAGTKAYPIDSSAVPPFSIGQRLPAPSESAPGPVVLIAGSPAASYATDLPGGIDFETLPVVVALGRRPPSGLTVSSCTSGEGLHISLWSGSGAQRSRLWSAYYYLGYDMEPSCTDSEWAD